MSERIKTAVIGCGLIGQRRAETASENKRSFLEMVVDIDKDAAIRASKKYGCRWDTDWRNASFDPGIDLVVVSTPNHMLCPIACASLKSGKHVLIEKPMGRNLIEAQKMRECSIQSGKKLKVGFNHRYHPALAMAKQLHSKGVVGKAINIRCHYGHGGRKGYEKEWRGNLKYSGGGELTDQGVHLIDLIQWLCGSPSEVFAVLQSAFWKMDGLEDNGFALLKYRSGLVASFHSSWTQWMNSFQFEIFGQKGNLSVSGLGGSYGPETLRIVKRKKEGAIPEIQTKVFQQKDHSWINEWDDFMHALHVGGQYQGTAEEGVSVMRTLSALYRSNRFEKAVKV